MAEELAVILAAMLRTPLMCLVRRATWTILAIVLNRALDYDARILHPEVFADLARRLDHVVLSTAFRIIDIEALDSVQEQCLRLASSRGGSWMTCSVAAGHRRKCLRFRGAVDAPPRPPEPRSGLAEGRSRARVGPHVPMLRERRLRDSGDFRLLLFFAIAHLVISDAGTRPPGPQHASHDQEEHASHGQHHAKPPLWPSVRQVARQAQPNDP